MRILRGLYLMSILVLCFYCSGRKEKQEEKTKLKPSASDSSEISNTWVEGSEMDSVWGDGDQNITNAWAEGAYKDEMVESKSEFYTDADGEKIYRKVSIPPSFVGGEKAMSEYIEKKKEGLNVAGTGKVFLAFIVSKNGAIKDVRVVKGINQQNDDIAKAMIVQMPNWDPAIRDGIPVSCIHGLSIDF